MYRMGRIDEIAVMFFYVTHHTCGCLGCQGGELTWMEGIEGMRGLMRVVSGVECGVFWVGIGFVERTIWEC